MTKGGFGSIRARASLALVALTMLVLCTTAGVPVATSATVNEPTTPILDNFNGRGIEDPLDQWGNWAPASIDGTGPTMGNFGSSAGQNDGQVVADSYRTTGVTGDAEVYATLSGLPENNVPTYLYLHLGDLGSTGWDGYRLRLERWVSSANDTVRIEKVTNGTPTSLASAALSTDFVSGQVFVLRHAGSSLTAWRKDAGVWSQLLSATDGASRASTSTRPGSIICGRDSTIRW
jgi:hypothetical protein